MNKTSYHYQRFSTVEIFPKTVEMLQLFCKSQYHYQAFVILSFKARVLRYAIKMRNELNNLVRTVITVIKLYNACAFPVQAHAWK